MAGSLSGPTPWWIGAAGVDEPLEGGALVPGLSDAFGSFPVGFPAEGGDLLVQRVRPLVQLAFLVQRVGYRAA